MVRRGMFYASGQPLTNSPDPKYEEEVSGCTSCVTVISKDRIFCVRVSYEKHD